MKFLSHSPLAMLRHISPLVLVLLLSLPVSANDGDRAADSLYAGIGGSPAIAKVVDSFIDIVSADARINASFANANIPRLKTLLNEQICEALGGPCKYTGRDMKSSHVGMGITEAQFSALAEDLYRAMELHGVPYSAQNRLMALLAPMHRDIVER